MIIGCAEKNSEIRIWNCFELGNVVGWIDKSLGCLGKKNTWDILCKKKKKKRKKEEECSWAIEKVLL